VIFGEAIAWVRGMLNDRILTCDQKSGGRLECAIDLSALYPSKSEFARFVKRCEKFLRSDESTQAIYDLKGMKLRYQSEQAIPSRTNRKPPLLLIFGNPASHSVASGCFFAYKNGCENRFWKSLLCEAGVVKFASNNGLSDRQRNSMRTKQVLSFEYESPFRIGLCVYISMPSPAGGPWSGVAGIRKLFGAQQLKRLEEIETIRVLEIAKSFLSEGGIAVAFQRNAWEGLRSENDPCYNILQAREAKLQGSLRGMQHTLLLGVPPTRLLGPARSVLRRFLSEQGYKLMPGENT
jgi:hypothetical protein